jgi:hypothetical protein
MAEKLTEAQAQEFADLTVWKMLKQGVRFGPDRSKYPWAEWTDGEWWMIRKDEDFDVSTGSMRSMLMTHAKRHSMKVQVIKRLDCLTFKFTDNG